MGLRAWASRLFAESNDVGFSRRLFGAKDSPSSDEQAPIDKDLLRKWLSATGGVLDPQDEILTDIAPSRMGVKKSGSDFSGGTGSGRRASGWTNMHDYFTLYRQMRRRDPKLKHLIGLRKYGVLAKELKIIAAEADPDPKGAEDRAAFVKAVLCQMDFKRDLRELLDAIPVGFAVSEIEWGQRTVRYGDTSRVAWVPVDIKQRRQGRFGFTASGEPRYIPEYGRDDALEPMKFIIHRHAPENEDPYGLSEAAEIWWWWFFKHQSIKWWMIFTEKFAMPGVVGLHPPNLDKATKTKFLRGLKRIQTEFAILMPKNVEVKLLEANRVGTINTYQSWVDYCDRCLSEALTGQSLASGQATEGNGTHAQADTHMEVRQEVVGDDCGELAGTLNTTLIPWIIYWNFGGETMSPRAEFDCSTEDLSADADLDSKLQGMGVDLSKNYLYSHYKRPRPVDEEDIAEPRGGGGFPFGGAPGDGSGDGASGAYGFSVTKRLAAKAESRNLAVKPDESVRHEALRRRAEVDTVQLRFVTDALPGYQKLTDAVKAHGESSADLAALYQAVKSLSREGKFTQDLARPMAANKIGGFLIAAAQVQRHTDEQKAKYDEVDYSNHARRFSIGCINARLRKFASEHVIEDYEPLPPEEAIRWFEELVPFTTSDMEKLIDPVNNGAFTVAGIEERDVLVRIQNKVAEYLKNGKSIEEWNKDFAATMDAMGISEMNTSRIAQLYRENLGRAYGAGRTRSMNDPEIRGAFAMWTRMAIDDDRTRETHHVMNGLNRPPDDHIWQTWNSPNDFGCRCDIIPRTAGEVAEKNLQPTERVQYQGAWVTPEEVPVNKAFRGIGF